MSKLMKSFNNIRLLDDLSKKNSRIHQIHPLIQLLTTAIYLAVVVSFDRFEVSRLLILIIYPLLIFLFADLPMTPIIKRVLMIEPFIIWVGILNPWFDHQTVTLFGLTISRGWLTFTSILIKSTLTATVSILLIATSGLEGIAASMRTVNIPKIFVLQLLLTYRYIAVLLEEVYRMQRAHLLRSAGKNGIHVKAWGSFVGQLFLRTYDRAQRIYQSMYLRGFKGEFHGGNIAKVQLIDIFYFAGWSMFFLLVRVLDIPSWVGMWMIGGIK